MDNSYFHRLCTVIKKQYEVKPHIYFKRGYWRVTVKPKPYRDYDEIWNKAHDTINELNFRRRFS